MASKEYWWPRCAARPHEFYEDECERYGIVGFQVASGRSDRGFYQCPRVFTENRFTHRPCRSLPEAVARVIEEQANGKLEEKARLMAAKKTFGTL